MQVEIAPMNFSSWSDLLVLLQVSFAYMAGRIDPPSSLNGMTEDDLREKAQSDQLITIEAGQNMDPARRHRRRR